MAKDLADLELCSVWSIVVVRRGSVLIGIGRLEGSGITTEAAENAEPKLAITDRRAAGTPADGGRRDVSQPRRSRGTSGFGAVLAISAAGSHPTALRAVPAAATVLVLFFVSSSQTS